MEQAVNSSSRFPGYKPGTAHVYDYGQPIEDRGQVIMSACSTLTVVSIITVAAWFYVVISMNRMAGYDDLPIGFALVGLSIHGRQCANNPSS